MGAIFCKKSLNCNQAVQTDLNVNLEFSNKSINLIEFNQIDSKNIVNKISIKPFEFLNSLHKIKRAQYGLNITDKVLIASFEDAQKKKNKKSLKNINNSNSNKLLLNSNVNKTKKIESNKIFEIGQFVLVKTKCGIYKYGKILEKLKKNQFKIEFQNNLKTALYSSFELIEFNLEEHIHLINESWKDTKKIN